VRPPGQLVARVIALGKTASGPMGTTADPTPGAPAARWQVQLHPRLDPEITRPTKGQR